MKAAMAEVVRLALKDRNNKELKKLTKSNLVEEYITINSKKYTLTTDFPAHLLANKKCN